MAEMGEIYGIYGMYGHDGTGAETKEVGVGFHCGRNPLLDALNALVARSLLRRTGSGHRNSPYLYELVESGEDDDDGLI